MGEKKRKRGKKRGGKEEENKGRALVQPAVEFRVEKQGRPAGDP